MPGIELNDFALALEGGDAVGVGRFLKRFPALRKARDTQGRPFAELAAASDNPEFIRLFDSNDSRKV